MLDWKLHTQETGHFLCSVVAVAKRTTPKQTAVYSWRLCALLSDRAALLVILISEEKPLCSFHQFHSKQRQNWYTNPDAHCLPGSAPCLTPMASVSPALSSGTSLDLSVLECLAQFPQSLRNPFPFWFASSYSRSYLLPDEWHLFPSEWPTFSTTGVWYLPHSNQQQQHLLKLVYFPPSLDYYLFLSTVTCLYSNTVWSMLTETQCILHRGDTNLSWLLKDEWVFPQACKAETITCSRITSTFQAWRHKAEEEVTCYCDRSLGCMWE